MILIIYIHLARNIKIHFLTDEYVKIKNNYIGISSFPGYIDQFFERIKSKIELDKKKKKVILSEYDNKDYFMKELEDILCSSLKRYLGIKEDDSDDESDSIDTETNQNEYI
jgi:hypothetical protein